MLTSHAEGLYTHAAPLKFLGLHLGTRMTLLRLPDGSLFVHSPAPLGDELARQVNALGTVRHIVAPNLFHHLFAGQWAKAYPQALLHAPRRLKKKRPDLRIDRELEETSPSEWQDALIPLHIDGSDLDETVFVHPGLGTLISSDLAENFVTSPHLPTRLYLKLAGLHGRVGWSRFLRFVYRDRLAARRSVDALLEHDFDRLILAHGNVIETDGKDALRRTFGFLD